MCCPTVVRRGKCIGRRGEKKKQHRRLNRFIKHPFNNITRYKKNKIFSVNDLSNNIASADYRWYGTLIPRVVAVGLKTPTLLTWPYTARVTHTPFCLEQQYRLEYNLSMHLHSYSHVVTLQICWDLFWSPFSHSVLSQGITWSYEWINA